MQVSRKAHLQRQTDYRIQVTSKSLEQTFYCQLSDIKQTLKVTHS